jgi:dienelactone hydrolase
MTFFRFAPLALAAALAFGAGPAAAQSPLAQARRDHHTQLVRRGDAAPEAPMPPKGVFDLVHYPSQVGLLAAYVTPDPHDGRKHPAIIWISGGDPNTIGEMWLPRPRSNDQTASAYRKAGIAMMVPSLRGGNDNPGRREGFYGEVDDVLAAYAYLAALPWVDPDRIYLGGAGAGGTLAMLVAESTSRFRAAFAFGPAANPASYGSAAVYHVPGDPQEIRLRAPVLWLDAVRTPLYVIEGIKGGNAGGNAGGSAADLAQLQHANHNHRIRFIPVPDKDRLGVLAPANELIAKRIAAELPADALLSADDAKAIGGR